TAIHSATGGVPRLVNQLGDQLVWMAQETGVAPLDASLVQQAWSELQQLPAPWNHEGAAHGGSGSSDSGVIEFGELDTPGREEARPGESATSTGRRPSVEIDDEMPASIPIARARPGRLLEATLDLEEFDASLDAAEELIESFDEFDHLEIRAADSPPSPPAGEPEPTAAQDPFAEPFDEEEIVLDPYSAFESELLRTAPQVINRLDRAFASELHRCVQRAAGKSPAVQKVHPPAHADEGMPPVATVEVAKPPATADLRQAAVRVVHAAEKVAPPAHVGDVLVIEDDDEAAMAAVIPGRQFRRLFSSLEASGRLG
ncbi:MAG TPA: hypothetical protein VF175_10740, partial [Lacipirellula sp.]